MPQLDVCFNMDITNVLVYLLIMSYGFWYLQNNKLTFISKVEKNLKLKMYYKNIIF
jgi:hypothetical protein